MKSQNNQETRQKQPAQKQDNKNDDAKAEPTNTPPLDNEINSNDNSKSVDAELRKLEQVESARDGNLLLRNQMILQAREKPAPPVNNGKTW